MYVVRPRIQDAEKEGVTPMMTESRCLLQVFLFAKERHNTTRRHRVVRARFPLLSAVLEPFPRRCACIR